MFWDHAEAKNQHIIIGKFIEAWRYSSVEKLLPSMHKAPGFDPQHLPHTQPAPKEEKYSLDPLDWGYR